MRRDLVIGLHSGSTDSLRSVESLPECIEIIFYYYAHFLSNLHFFLQLTLFPLPFLSFNPELHLPVCLASEGEMFSLNDWHLVAWFDNRRAFWGEAELFVEATAFS